VPGLYTSVDDARAPGHCVLVGWCGCPQLSLPRDHRRLASSRHPCWLPAAARIAMRVGLGHCSNASLLTADTHISVRSGCCRLLLQTAAAAAAACFPPACSVSIYTPCATCAHKCASRRPQEPPCRPIHACSVQGGLALCAYVQSGDPEAEALEALGEVAGLDGLAADQASASAPGQQLSSKSQTAPGVQNMYMRIRVRASLRAVLTAHPAVSTSNSHVRRVRVSDSLAASAAVLGCHSSPGCAPLRAPRLCERG